MGELAGHINVAHARTAALIAEALDTGAWSSPGIHSVEHWVRLHLGVNEAAARMLCRVAARWSDFSETMGEFTTGSLSLAQVDVIVARAPMWADYRLARFAAGLSVSQLRSMIRDEFFEYDTPTGDPPPEPEAEAETPPAPAPVGPVDRFGYEWRDGRLHLSGEFAADRGTAIETILEHARDELFRTTGHAATGADAFVELITRATTTAGDTNHARLAELLGRMRTFLHLEIGDAGSRLVGHLSNGVRLPQALVDYLTCDEQVTPVWEHDHTPVGYGRTQRIVPTLLRRLIEHRDRGCRVPGCGSRHVEIHHLVHWEHGGTTDTPNLVSLCARHHRQHHQGVLLIDGDPDRADGLVFTDSTGKPIRASAAIPPTEPLPPPTKKFEPATLQRMTLHQFVGWTERGANTNRAYREQQQRQQRAHLDDDDAH